MLKVWPVDMNSKSDVEYIMDELRLNPYQRMAVLSRRRDSEAVKCRTKVVVELRKLGYSLPEIGRVMDRHHTSVLNLLQIAEAETARAKVIGRRMVNPLGEGLSRTLGLLNAK